MTLEAGAVDAVAVAATRPSHVDEEREPGVGRQDPNVCVLALERASQQEGDVAGAQAGGRDQQDAHGRGVRL
ncbi:MAG: hypothetical protein E6G06_07600 [Actinobacteria bacterium]|nr:MAG: hypothetical protein E6G06_07600 [Actinomycetota bacterium]